MSHLFLQVISWIEFVRTTVSESLKVICDPALSSAEENKTKISKDLASVRGIEFHPFIL